MIEVVETMLMLGIGSERIRKKMYLQFLMRRESSLNIMKNWLRKFQEMRWKRLQEPL